MTKKSLCTVFAFAWSVGFCFGEPLPVKTLIYMDLREIDGAHQSFSADVFVRLQWKDPGLSSAEGERMVPVTDAWNPGIQIVNRVQVQTTLPEVLEVDENGNVTYRQRFIGQFSSLLDLHEFPLDRQTLSIRIVSPGKFPDDVKFQQDPEGGGMVHRAGITDWKIGAWRTREEQYQVAPGARPIAGFVFELDVVRHFYFFFVQIIIPMTLILGMSWIVFWLDPATPVARISISITSMLTVVAYRFLLGSFLPRLAFLTRMDYFVFGCTFLVFLSLVCVVVIIRLSLGKKEGSAARLDFHFRWVFPTLYAVISIACFVL